MELKFKESLRAFQKRCTLRTRVKFIVPSETRGGRAIARQDKTLHRSADDGQTPVPDYARSPLSGGMTPAAFCAVTSIFKYSNKTYCCCLAGGYSSRTDQTTKGRILERYDDVKSFAGQRTRSLQIVM
jgi:hypothetical protein